MDALDNEKRRAERAERMKAAALEAQDLYAPGSEHIEFTELNTDEILDDTCPDADLEDSCMGEPAANHVIAFQIRSAAWEKNRAAFHAMLDDLKTKYEAQLVAVHNGEVVASGTETRAVRLAASNKVGEAPVYIGVVSKLRIVRCMSFWKVRKP